MEKKRDSGSLIEEIERNSVVMTAEEWSRMHVITDFTPLGNGSEEAKKFPLRPLTEEDLFFTDEIEDDRINCTAEFSDYDWMTYRYEMRFPTKNLGMLAVRHEYFGSRTCLMEVRQFLPSRLTGSGNNVVVCRAVEYPTEVFMKYMAEDLRKRIEDAESDGGFAYYPGELLLDWFNCVVERWKEKETAAGSVEPMRWESVRVPIKNEGERILITYDEKPSPDGNTEERT